MFFLNYIVFILIILFTHLLALSIQAMSGNQYFFGVYVKEIIIEEDIKKKINKDFKKKLNISLILSILVYLILKDIFEVNIGANIILSTTLYFVLFYLILRLEYKKIKYIKTVYLQNFISENKKRIIERDIIKEDEELTKLKGKLIKKFKILFGICVALSILSLLYVILNYKNMPDVIITHWGGNGKPDGFATKNIMNVFFINFVDLSMVILFAVLGVGSVCSNTYIDTENIEKNRQRAIKYLNGIGYTFFILTLSIQSMTTTIPVFMVQEKDIPMWLTITGCILPVFTSIALIYYYMMLNSLRPKNRGAYTIENDDEKWIYGFIYYNKEDPKLTVEKRLGMGWSINMAHPLGKFITVIIFIMTVGSLLICFV